MTNEQILVDEYSRWIEWQELPLMSADELIHENLTDYQRSYVSDFIMRWEKFVGE